MTDNEIIKALECCSSNQHCWLCVLKDREDDCYEILKYALDLINRQKAEIEKLQVSTMVCEQRELIIENSKLVSLNWENQLVAGIKSEAIKEFAERLTNKAELIRVTAFNSKWAISDEDIDNLVKEMTESEE